MPPFGAPQGAFERLDEEEHKVNDINFLRSVELPKHRAVTDRARQILNDYTNGSKPAVGRKPILETPWFENPAVASGSTRVYYQLSNRDLGSIQPCEGFRLFVRVTRPHTLDPLVVLEDVTCAASIGEYVKFSHNGTPLPNTERGVSLTPSSELGHHQNPFALRSEEPEFQTIIDTLEFIAQAAFVATTPTAS